MHGNQLCKKVCNPLGRKLNQVQTLAQFAQHARDDLHQAFAIAFGYAGLHAPVQLGHQFVVALRVAGAIGTAQLRLSHRLRPRAADKIYHGARYIHPFSIGAKFLRQILRQHVALLGMHQRPRGFFAARFVFCVQAFPLLFQLLQHVAKGLRCIVGLGRFFVQRRNAFFYRLDKLRIALVAFGSKRQAAIGCFVQKLPRCMLLVAKKSAVYFGDVHQHRFQRLQMPAHCGQQALILNQVVQHQAHHFFA